MERLTPDYLSCYDYPLLNAAGFKPGIADTIFWKDNWQVHLDGDKMLFIEHSDDYRRAPQIQMTRQEFGERFM